MIALMDLRRSIVVLMVLAAVLVSLGGVGPFGSSGEGGGCGCCSDCGDGCACPLEGLDDGVHSATGDASAGPRFGGPVVSSACGGCPVAVGNASGHRLDAREARAFARTERPVRVGRALETRPSERSAEPCPDISPRAPPSVRV